MPELAEVEFFRKQWDPGIGHVFDRVSVHPKARIFRETPAPTFKKQLAGETLEASHTHGKKWMFQFSNGKWLAGHLGMTGKLFTASSDYKPEKHDHLISWRGIRNHRSKRCCLISAFFRELETGWPTKFAGDCRLIRQPERENSTNRSELQSGNSHANCRNRPWE